MKKWYKSKLLWINAIGIVGIILQTEYGYVVTPELQVLALGAINFVIRAITKEPLEWKSSGG